MKRSEKDSRAEVWAMFKKHTQVPKSVTKWAARNAFDKGCAYRAYKEGRYWCSDCGQVIEDLPQGTEQIVCPHCGKTLEIAKRCYSDWGKGITRRCDYAFVQRRTVIQEWQVIQEFAITKYSIRGKAASYFTTLVYEHWLNPERRKAYILGRYLKMSPYYQDMPFSLSSVFSFRHLTGWYQDWRDKIVPGSKTSPLFSRFNPDEYRAFFGIKASDEELYHAFSKAPVIAETLYKTGEYNIGELFFTSTLYRGKIIKYWRPILVARRHGYLKKLSGTLGLRDWLDYLDELRYLKRDTHNPHFICPDNFQEAHSDTTIAYHRKREKAYEKTINARKVAEERRQLELIEKDKRARQSYGKKILPYAALVITDENLHIAPLLSIQDFMEEGAAMCHCVFSNKYYAREDCLILSARDRNGERVETIEIDTKNWVIVQSRAYKNGQSKFHDEIISLLNANMDMIKQCNNHKQTTRKAV